MRFPEPIDILSLKLAHIGGEESPCTVLHRVEDQKIVVVTPDRGLWGGAGGTQAENSRNRRGTEFPGEGNGAASQRKEEKIPAA